MEKLNEARFDFWIQINLFCMFFLLMDVPRTQGNCCYRILEFLHASDSCSFQIQAQPTQLNSALLKSVFVEDLDVLIVSSEDGNICKCLYMFHEISLALKINPRPSVSLHSDAILRHCHIPIVIVAFWFIR